MCLSCREANLTSIVGILVDTEPLAIVLGDLNPVAVLSVCCEDPVSHLAGYYFVREEPPSLRFQAATLLQ